MRRKKVSIVSIHADQSRQSKDCKLIETYQRFQSYQFMQINPDHLTIGLTLGSNISFNRINSCRSIPTLNKAIALPRALESFNRINSCRSIPTRIRMGRMVWWTRVSIVSIHADQSRLWDEYDSFAAVLEVSIVSIHADQSRLAYALWLLAIQ